MFKSRATKIIHANRLMKSLNSKKGRVYTLDEIKEEWEPTYNKLKKIKFRCKPSPMLKGRWRKDPETNIENIADSNINEVNNPPLTPDEDDDELIINDLKIWLEKTCDNEEDFPSFGKKSFNRGVSMYEEHGITNQELINIMKKADQNHDGKLSKNEFFEMMLNYYNNFPDSSTWKKYWRTIAYADVYTCTPPRLFIPLMCLLQICVWIHHEIYSKGTFQNYEKAVEPICSKLAYNPDRRWEAWRFFTYCFVHANAGHLFRNLLGQMIVGIPLEMSHSTWRVAVLYILGVIGGALGSVVMTQDTRPLTGASGGFYALMAAHIASLLLNWKSDSLIFRQRMRNDKPAKAILATHIRSLRLMVLLGFFVLDICFYVYDRLGRCEGRVSQECNSKVNYTAHLFGVISGLLVGFVILKDRNCHLRKDVLKKIVICIIIILYGAAIYQTVEKQLMNESNENTTSYLCGIYNYTKSCHMKCFERNLSTTFDCHVSFCN